MKVALWATNLSHPVDSIDAWISLVDKQMKYAHGADVLVMPEYACMHWLGFKPRDIKSQDELRWMASHVNKALSGLTKIVDKHDIGLLSGTMPVEEGVLIKNRAHLLLPNLGVALAQDKLHPIPTERDRKGWFVSPGMRGVQTIDWRGFRICVVICHDTQSTTLGSKLRSLRPNLVLVPSMTEHEGGTMGHKAIFSASRSLAIDLGCAVCAVGSVGTQGVGDRQEPNVGGTGVYIGRRVIGYHGPFSESPDAWGPLNMDTVFHVEQEITA